MVSSCSLTGRRIANFGHCGREAVSESCSLQCGWGRVGVPSCPSWLQRQVSCHLGITFSSSPSLQWNQLNIKEYSVLQVNALWEEDQVGEGRLL